MTTPTDTGSPISVTQEDEDAAEVWRMDLDPGMRSLLAAHFARHRIAAEQRARIAPASDMALVEELAHTLFQGGVCLEISAMRALVRTALLPIIKRERLEAARAGLEAAMKVTVGYVETHGEPWCDAGDEIANAIRAIDPAAIAAKDKKNG